MPTDTTIVKPTAPLGGMGPEQRRRHRHHHMAAGEDLAGGQGAVGARALVTTSRSLAGAGRRWWGRCSVTARCMASMLHPTASISPRQRAMRSSTGSWRL
ncbi:MAG: hypothetical protein M3066_05505 [Actinomycetota bacterium]|nr:hypothetical protein [Actinomycetota bacterium]